MSSGRWASLTLFGPALAWGLAALGGLGWTLADRSAWAELDRHAQPRAGSDSCRACHPQQWDSWHRSWHRTMTQRVRAGGALEVELEPQPTPQLPPHPAPGQAQAGVLAPFAGETLDYGGFRATMTRDAQGRPRVRVVPLELDRGEPAGPPVLDVEVALSVGSHRYQQYLAYLDRGGGEAELWRLPVAWHRAEARWIHMNGAFVEPEGELGSLADYERHLSRWNDNCVFCHNTGAVPGLRVGGQGEPAPALFETRVAELGISCEACHGPAQAHVRRHRQNPLRRMLALDRARADGSIAHPGRLDPARSSEVCGRCHGQRIARDIGAVMAAGDGFVAGDALADISRPIFADSRIAGSEALGEGQPFAARFWPDHSPRLSAYEYQGLLLSPCWDEGQGLGCGDCHDMHGEQPDGQLRAGKERGASCLSCHAQAQLGTGSEGLGIHGGHPPSAEVDCLDCHMPRTTYGLLEGMISHRITSPDPGAWVGRDDQPDACTQCHVDRSRAWAAGAMAQLGLEGSEPGTPGAHERQGSRVALDLLGGDAIARNLAADALAQPKATGSHELRMAWLGEALEDEYPSVRWFAWRGLRSLAQELPAGPRRERLLAGLEAFDYLAPVEARVELVAELRAQLGPGPLADQPELREQLLDRRQASPIWIGE